MLGDNENEIHNEWEHGRPQKFFRGGQRQHFANPCQVADDAVEIYVHETPFLHASTTKKMSRVTTRVTRMRLFGSHSQVYYDNFHNMLSAVS